ncbi:MAG: phosphoglycerate dehydrogenase [Bacteroidia bacterium]|nr:phosphoglycerate dehydrogenase [Bacteroidia bacterium]
MQNQRYIVLDFDSTFLQVEALEELAKLSLANHPEQVGRQAEIKKVTEAGANGEISLEVSLARRMELLEAHRDHIPLLIQVLKEKVSVSIARNKAFFEKHAQQVYIISNSFRELIIPVVADYFIPESHVLGNEFVYDAEGEIVGLDENNPLASTQGKATVLAALKLPGEILVIGDAFMDYQMKVAGLAHKFFAFTENVLRSQILDKADFVIHSFDEFLYENHLPMTVSYPKSKIKALILENIHPNAEKAFQGEGYQIETVSSALDEEELIERIEGVSILCIRSKTSVTRRVVEAANRLLAVGTFSIGTNQIDLEACAERGVIVFNAPYSNTRSVVELAIGEIIMLMRRIPEMNAGMHRGKWNKSAKHSYEIRGKKLGIIGYGNIGSQLSVLAEAMGMKVYYYDMVEKLQMGNAIKVDSLQEMLSQVDVATIHVDGRPENKYFFGKEQIGWMKPGSLLLNLARGPVVDLEALEAALASGHIAGAGLDVYPEEPKNNDEEFVSKLREYDNVILTPHVGGSTEEAQFNIAQYVPARILAYINTGSSFGAVNFPNVQLPEQKQVHRLIHIHRNVPGILAKINQALARHEVNIAGQYLKTDEQIGYVITDINRQYDDELLTDLKQIPDTIKFRVLY